MRAGFLLASRVALSLVALCLWSLAAEAKHPTTILVSGRITYSVTGDSMPLGSDGLVLVREKMEGTVKASDPNSLIHDSKQTCTGSIVFKGQEAVHGGGYCETVDVENDVWWLQWWAGSTDSHWEVLGGTGKYEGLEGSGYTFYAEAVQGTEASESFIQGFEGALIFK